MISIVIPVLNEELNLAPLHREIDEVLRGAGLQAEMIIVDSFVFRADRGTPQQTALPTRA